MIHVVRVGVYADAVYRQDDGGISVGQSFVSWVAGLASHVESLTLFGRFDPVPGRGPHPVPEVVPVVPLPFYAGLGDVGAVARAIPVSRKRFAEHLTSMDICVLFGPHPLGLVFARQARRAGIPVVVGVRQDFPAYIRARVRRPSLYVAYPVAVGLEQLQRRVALGGGALVIGEEAAHAYRHASHRLVTGVSLVTDAEIVSDEAVLRPWPRVRTMLSVTRLDPEKNPLLLVDVLVLLRRQEEWQLVVAGAGPLRRAMEERAREHGVLEYVHLVGDIDRSTLRDLYLSASVFLHVSWTEGLPQVLYEAAAAGTPIVATAVGSVAHALGNGRRGELVPPGDAAAAAEAIRRLEDGARRQRNVLAALSWAREDTADRQAQRVAMFLSEVCEAHTASATD
jgi:glycosyltransferase involved in cell wall biosynthesis